MGGRVATTAFLLMATAACSGTSAEPTTTTAPVTTTAAAVTTVTTTPVSTTVADTTTTTDATTTTTSTTSTTLPGPTPDIPLGPADPSLEAWAGLWRQPTTFTRFMELRVDGIVLAGLTGASLPYAGTWEHDAAGGAIVFTDFDPATDCAGAPGRYARVAAPGGGLTLTVADDPCDGRVRFLTQPGASCRCMTWLPVADEE